jgi:hypothetical protein
MIGKHLVYDGVTYAKRYFKSDFSNEFLSKVKSIDWISEPFAWVHGQFLSHMFKETDYLKQFISDYTKGLKLNFDLPFVGYISHWKY